MNATGTALCLVKGVQDELPFAVQETEVEYLGGTKYIFMRPKGVYKRGVGGVRYKLLSESYRPYA